MEQIKSLDLRAVEQRIIKNVTTSEALRDVSPFTFKNDLPEITVKRR